MLSPHPEKWGGRVPPPRPPPIDARDQANDAIKTKRWIFKDNILLKRNGSGVELRTHDYEQEPGFESCAAVLKPWASFFTLHCSSSLSCINEYVTIDSGGYVYEQLSRFNCSIWLDSSQRSRDGI